LAPKDIHESQRGNESKRRSDSQRNNDADWGFNLAAYTVEISKLRKQDTRAYWLLTMLMFDGALSKKLLTLTTKLTQTKENKSKKSLTSLLTMTLYIQLHNRSITQLELQNLSALVENGCRNQDFRRKKEPLSVGKTIFWQSNDCCCYRPPEQSNLLLGGQQRHRVQRHHLMSGH